MESKIQTKVNTYSQDLPQRRQDIPREGVQPADAVYQINKLGTFASFYLTGSNAAGTGNYEDPFFVAPIPMQVISWYVYYKVASSNSGDDVILQVQETGGDVSSVGNANVDTTATTGNRGTITGIVNLNVGDSLRIAASGPLTDLDGLCATVYLVPTNLGGFFTAV